MVSPSTTSAAHQPPESRMNRIARRAHDQHQAKGQIERGQEQVARDAPTTEIKWDEWQCVAQRIQRNHSRWPSTS